MDTGNSAQGSTSAERKANGIQRIRDMVTAAGLPNPYIVAHSSFDHVQNAKDYGLDAVTAYNYATSGDFAVQQKKMEDAKSSCISNGVDFIPSLMPSRDDVAWRTDAGFAYSGEDFESQLTWAKNTMLSGYTPPKSNGIKIINLSTWDEYGEGHILAPTEGNGFMYLDAVRNVMTTGGAHTDTVPTSQQKERISGLYRQERKVNNVKFTTEDQVPINKKVYYGKVEREIENGIPSKVVKTWDFKTQADAAKVSGSNIRNKSGDYVAGNSVSSITRQSDGIKVVPASASGFVSPTITISDIENIDIHNVTYLKIRMKKNAKAAGGSVSWSTNFYDKTSTGRAVGFNAYNTSSSSFVDYYAPVYESAAWTGKLTSLDITLGRVTDTNPFVVDSVTLLADETLDNKDKVVTSEQTAILNNEFRTQSDELMVPFNEVGKILGADSINIFGSEERYIVEYGDLTSEFTVGSQVAKVGGVSINLAVAPYRVSSAISDTVYVPLSLVNAVFYNIDTTYDSSTKTLTATKNVPDAEKLISSVEFDATDDLKRNTNITVLNKSGDGYVKVLAETNDPQLYINTDNMGAVQATSAKGIEIRLWSDTASNIELFFQTNNDAAYDGAKRFWTTTKVGYNVIKIDTTKLATWADTITALRLDPATAEGVTVVIDSIAYVKSVPVEPVVEPEDPDDPTPVDPVTPPISASFEPFYTLNKGPVISVYGKLDARYAEKFVTVLLLDKNVALSDVNTSNIKAICQGSVGENGKYELTFKCPSGTNPSDCTVYTRVGNEDISATVTTAFASINELVDFSASVVTEENTATMNVQITDEYGFPMSALKFVPVMAFYDENGAITSVSVGEQHQTTISAEVPTGTQRTKAFIWESMSMPLPLYTPAP